MFHLITVGGGAAGFFGSITAAENGAENVLMLEKSPKLLTKVKISGGGRCNVTHHCFDPKALSKFYPRGEKSLIGPLHRWGAQDTVDWFQSRGVELKTEADGRMFPVTDDSQTVIDCLMQAAHSAGVQIETSNGVKSIIPLEENQPDGARFLVHTDKGESHRARCVLIATGGTRLTAGAKLAEQLGHTLEPPVPSLFTFKIDHPLIKDLPGLSVTETHVSIENTKLKAEGPLLITHWGLSGPGILRLSAWGARELESIQYQCTLHVNWLPHTDAAQRISQLRNEWGKRQLSTRCPFDAIPKRLWAKMLETAQIPPQQTWAQLPKNQAHTLSQLINHCKLPVQGKSLNKDEFVTAGGVLLNEINLKTMQSKRCPGLYFAGEVMNVDGITGGFNFQNAWMSGHHAGDAIATDYPL
ncbi:NAD(P)/FAD-dependent oxidoreductase [Rubritalea tangerina]|uniref:NAD(P)/FAD-dependent oxidoreductase n=1 Tax=Rubritalea tangerina TaxID=430798 RepID=A0ABW4Z6P7_9BACT